MIELSKKDQFNNNTYWINSEITLNNAKKVGFNVAEKRDINGNVVKKVVIAYDVAKQELYVDCSFSEKEHKPAVNLIQTFPLKPQNNKIRLQILLDKSSLEVFGDDGEKVLTTLIYPDADATGFSVFGDGNAIVNSLKIWDLVK